MSGHYLTDAADWLRAAGLVVVEYGGWQYRAKSSGGYAPGRPWGVMIHHTAGNSDAEADSYYQCYSANAAPISNATIDRNGDVWLLAAGPTNTNGLGTGGISWSKGRVPDNSMNSYAFGIELCNNGVGGEYPQAQIDAAFTVANTINAHCGNQPDDVALHVTYSPGRKVDPARFDAVIGPWQPHGTNRAGSWHVDDVRAECLRRGAPLSPKEDDLMITIFQCSDADAAFVGATSAGVGVHISWADADMAGRYRAIASVVEQVVTVAQLESMVLVGRLPEGDSRHDWDGFEFAHVVT